MYNVDVDLDGDGDFISNLENSDTVAGCMTTALNCNITNLAVGEKVWRLRINGQITPFVRSFVVSPPILPAPRLLTPTNNRIFGVLSTPPYSAVSLSWSAVNNASGYVLQIDEKREFDTELLFERVLSETQLTVDAQTLGLVDGTYYWRVATFSSLNVKGNWSSPFAFVINTQYSTRLAPANNAIVSPTANVAFRMVKPDCGHELYPASR